MRPEFFRTVSPRWRWVCLALVVLATGLFWWNHMSANGRRADRLAAAKAAGYPVTLAELEKWRPAPPPGQNAALIVLEAAEQRKSLGSREDSIQSRRGGEPLDPETKEVLQELVTQNRACLELLHKAAALSGKSRYPATLTNGVSVNLPYLASIKGLLQLLRHSAALHAENGEAEAAVTDVLASVRVARTLEDEPFLISQLVRISGMAITTASLERVLSRVRFSESQLVRIEESLGAAESMISHAQIQAFAGERCLGREWFESPALRRSPIYQVQRLFGLTDRDYGYYWEMTDQIIAAAKLPFPDRVTEYKRLEKTQGAIPRWYVFSRLIAPSASKSLFKFVSETANLRAARTAVAIERYTLAHEGKLPGILADLAPAWQPAPLADPYTGGPLQFTKLSKGYLIFSLGYKNENADGQKARYLGFGVER